MAFLLLNYVSAAGMSGVILNNVTEIIKNDLSPRN